MIVTGEKLTELVGYTTAQIKHRRQKNWTEGVHFWFDPANKVVYDLRIIEQWQKSTRPESEIKEENVKSDGTSVRSVGPRCSRSNIPPLEFNKRKK